MDRLFFAALPRISFFSEGWGDDDVLDSSDVEDVRRSRIPVVDPALARERRVGQVRVVDGTFESPEVRLPEAVRRARFRLLLPRREPRAVCIHLASSGDEGFGWRTFMAWPLLQSGIASLMLENAYYGSRRPPGQRWVSLRRVSDLVLQAFATLLETRALLAWLRRCGHGRVGVAGYSMGGGMAAVAGACVPFPVALVPVAAPATPANALCEGLLARHVDWRGFARHGGQRGGTPQALSRYLRRFDVRRLAPPAAPECAVLVATALDGVVDAADMRDVAAHWRGSELRSLSAGHVTGALACHRQLRAAVVDAFDRLPAARALGEVRGRAAGRPAWAATRRRTDEPRSASWLRAAGDHHARQAPAGTLGAHRPGARSTAEPLLVNTRTDAG